MKIEDMKIAVVGAGIMGQGIALSFALAGFSVKVVDMNNQVLEKAMAQAEVDLKLFEEQGFLDSKPAVVRSRLTTGIGLAAATGDCDFVVEAVTEILKLKKELFARLEGFCPEDTILSSNTSSLRISDIVEGLRNPGRVIGTHFFNPAHIMPLVEIIPAPHQTTEKVLDITKQLMEKIGKKAIIVRKEVPGFVVNRITSAIHREVHYMVQEGIATPEEIDIATRASLGLRYAWMGPFKISDLAGLDTGILVGEQLYKTLDNSTEPPQILRDKVKKGELGVKSGKGWYDYTGRSKEQILAERNRKLLQQLVLIKAHSKE